MHVYPLMKSPRQPTSSAKQTAHNYLVQPQHRFQKGSVSVATLLPGDTRSCAADTDGSTSCSKVIYILLLATSLLPPRFDSRINSTSRFFPQNCLSAPPEMNLPSGRLPMSASFCTIPAAFCCWFALSLLIVLTFALSTQWG